MVKTGSKFRAMVHHVERTEGKKFRKMPTVHLTKKRTRWVGNSYVSYTEGRDPKTGKKKPAKIRATKISIRRSFAQNYNTSYVGAVVMHELRENLNVQHGMGVNSPRTNPPSVHRHANPWLKKDERWIKRKWRHIDDD